jgi:hypothetical protein
MALTNGRQKSGHQVPRPSALRSSTARRIVLAYAGATLTLLASAPMGRLNSTRPSHPETGQGSERSAGSSTLAGSHLKETSIRWPFVQEA